MKILCVGHAAYDVTVPIATYPIENTKNRVDTKIECGGGPASNAAYLLGKWGMDTTFVGMVGHDLYGERIKHEFDAVGVSTKYLQMSEVCQTTSSFIIASGDKGTRTVLTYRPSNTHIDDIHLDFEPDIILFDGDEIDLSLTLLKRYPNAISVIDAGRVNPDTIKLAKLVDYVVCSKDFAESITKIKLDFDNFITLSNLYHEMENQFKGTIVVTLEAKGSLYKVDNQIKIMPSLSVKAIDSTGAGDIYHGAFIYGLAHGMPLEQNIRVSNIAGALSVTKLGGRFSMPSKDEIKKLLHDFR